MLSDLWNRFYVLKQLKDGWYKGNARETSIAPTEASIRATEHFINTFVGDNTSPPFAEESYLPVPDIFPTVNGTFQLEWAIHNIDLEIEIHSETKYHLLFEQNFIDKPDDKIDISYSFNSVEDDIFLFTIQQLRNKHLKHIRTPKHDS